MEKVKRILPLVTTLAIVGTAVAAKFNVLSYYSCDAASQKCINQHWLTDANEFVTIQDANHPYQLNDAAAEPLANCNPTIGCGTLYYGQGN
jgi:hypothetical protein